jgi:hypothetical protein
MNERIKQLAIEAGMIVGEANGFDMTRLMPKEVKFAELIVRECAQFTDSDIRKFILKHFGVEE